MEKPMPQDFAESVAHYEYATKSILVKYYRFHRVGFDTCKSLSEALDYSYYGIKSNNFYPHSIYTTSGELLLNNKELKDRINDLSLIEEP